MLEGILPTKKNLLENYIQHDLIQKIKEGWPGHLTYKQQKTLALGMQ
jgi:hypothetical protein